MRTRPCVCTCTCRHMHMHMPTCPSAHARVGACQSRGVCACACTCACTLAHICILTCHATRRRAGPSTTGGGRHWPQPATYDPRRRAVARGACRAIRHSRGARPPLQPGPQAPRAGHADRSLTQAAWQTVTKARAKCSGKGPYRRAAAAPRPRLSRRGHARGRRRPSHIAVSETATTQAVTATGTTAAITVADMSTGAPAARRGRPPPPVAASETRQAPSTPSSSHPPASRHAAGTTDIVERPATSRKKVNYPYMGKTLFGPGKTVKNICFLSQLQKH